MRSNGGSRSPRPPVRLGPMLNKKRGALNFLRGKAAIFLASPSERPIHLLTSLGERPIHLLQIALLAATFFLASCAAPDTRHHVVISTQEEKLALLDRGTLMAVYPVSTSKFGLGDALGSGYTP